MKNLMRLTLFFCILFNSGCIGTIMTRSNDTPFGPYPYQAPYVDILIADWIIENNPLVVIPLSIVFIVIFPIDVALDTVLLPLDLVFWAAGAENKMD